MTGFDPYHIWLGIPPEEQPPNHYRLLGISTFESDRDVIRNAADQRMSYLRTYGGGQHSELSQKLLNEVSAAKVCLVNPDKKAAYDASLREQLGPSPAEGMPTESITPAIENDRQLPALVTAPQRARPAGRKKKGRPSARKGSPELLWVGVALILAMLLVWYSVWYFFFRDGTLILKIEPIGLLTDVRVTVDREVIPASGLQEPLKLPPGKHELVVRGLDFRPERRSVMIQAGEEKVVSVDLVVLEPVDNGARSRLSGDEATGKQEPPFTSPEDPPPPLASAPFDAPSAKKHQRAWADYLDVPLEKDIDVGEGVSMSFVLIPPGEFMMGSPEDETGRDHDEPQHPVRITEPFYLGTTEATQGQWESVMGTQPWRGEYYVKAGTDYPAVCVRWEDAVVFCHRLSEREGVEYRLPTEAEWEYACRAGTTTQYSFGDDESALGDYAWFRDNAWGVGEEYAHEVGQKRVNGFGLYDMHGNV